MQLINKTDKILSGSISKTGDFEMYKKVIGVNSSNLKSNAQGIVPLANTSSHEKEKVESEISVPVMESLDLGSDVAEEKVDIPSIDLGSLSLGQKDQEPDLQGAVPVSVSDTSSLESIDLPKIPSLDSPIESQNIEAKKEVINKNLSTEDQLKAIHDYIIDNSIVFTHNQLTLSISNINVLLIISYP